MPDNIYLKYIGIPMHRDEQYFDKVDSLLLIAKYLELLGRIIAN